MQFRSHAKLRTSSKSFLDPVARQRVLIGVVAAMGTFMAQAAAPQTVGPQTMKLAMAEVQNHFVEQCFTLEAGQQLDYRLSTPHPVEFNLHHHSADGKTHFPDKRLVTKQHANQIVADSGGAYCFMAKNLQEQPGSFNVVINYEITAR